MAELILDRQQKVALRADAHHLSPVVLLGRGGFTDEVVKEVDRALSDHGLIKIKVPSDDREERVEIYEALADRLGAARIQLIGKILVLYRPVEEREEEKTAVPAPAAKAPRRKAPSRPKKLSGAKGMKKIRVRDPKRVTKKSALS